MTAGGWFVMILSVGGAVVFFGVCMGLVLTTRNSEVIPTSEAEMDDINLDVDDDAEDESAF